MSLCRLVFWGLYSEIVLFLILLKIDGLFILDLWKIFTSAFKLVHFLDLECLYWHFLVLFRLRNFFFHFSLILFNFRIIIKFAFLQILLVLILLLIDQYRLALSFIIHPILVCLVLSFLYLIVTFTLIRGILIEI